MKRLSMRKLLVATLFISFVLTGILIITRYKQEANLKQINLTLKQSDTTIAQLESVIFPEKNQNFPVWKTIELGPHQDVGSIRKELGSRGFEIEYWANNILNKTPIGQKRTRLKLGLVSSAQLGFKELVTYQEIFKRAQELGLKPLPAEVAPRLRLQYQNQPENEWLHIGMEPITASDGDPTVFDILHFDNHAHDNAHDNPTRDNSSARSHSLQLCSSSVRSDVLWSLSSRWIFATN